VEGPGNSAEFGVGAAPFLTSTPTPAPQFAMLHKKDTQPKSAKKPAPQPQPRPKAQRCPPNWVCTGAVCTLVFTGCATSAPQPVDMYPRDSLPPPPEECPPSVVKLMTKELGIRLRQDVDGEFPVEGNAEPVPVQESTPFTLGYSLGKLRYGTVLFGRLFIRDKYVYGRFTEAHTPSGQTFPVCFALRADRLPGGGPDTAIVFSTQAVWAVDVFKNDGLFGP
jgi:eukaryotic-like serine/threonine-protein kinase